MANLQLKPEYILRVSDADVRIIGLALAAMAGREIKVKDEERAAADDMNIRLMEQRASSLRACLAVAEGVLMRAKEPMMPEEEVS